MKRLSKFVGIIALVAVIGFSVTACDDGGSSSPAGGGVGGGDGWSTWRSVTLASHTQGVQFSRWMVGPEPPQGAVVEIQLEGLTPTSLTLSASVPHGAAAAPQAGATFRFRYRQSGGRGHSGTNPIHFLW